MCKCKMLGQIIIAGALVIPGALRGAPNGDGPTGKGGGTRVYRPDSKGAKGSAKLVGTNGIFYHGGPLMLGTINMYFILYGEWSPAQTELVQAWGENIGGSPYFNINTTYYDANRHHVSNSVKLAGVATDEYSQGTALTDALVGAVLELAILAGPLPLDPNGVYFILTSADVAETSGFCVTYCGWHTASVINGTPVHYAFVGNSERCIGACADQPTSPNHAPGIDGMISIMAHELVESANDPEYTAWWNQYSEESADMCEWTFGITYTTENGSKANINLGGRDYLIQRNWVNADGGYCALKYP